MQSDNNETDLPSSYDDSRNWTDEQFLEFVCSLADAGVPLDEIGTVGVAAICSPLN
jgi:hypothetical protein